MKYIISVQDQPWFNGIPTGSNLIEKENSPAKTPEDYGIVNRGKFGNFEQDICGDSDLYFVNYGEFSKEVTQVLKDCETSESNGIIDNYYIYIR